MKKIFRLLIALLVLVLIGSGTAMGAPFLVADPAQPGDNVISFKLWMDEILIAEQPVVANALRYDLKDIPAGTHVFKAQYCNVWGCSADSAPFQLQRSNPVVPLQMRLVNQ